MTMLYSFYTDQGIIFAADSRITRKGQTQPERSQRKVLRVPRVGVHDGLVGYYGLAEVNRQPMSAWLAFQINRWPGSHSPVEFAQYLAAGLEREATPREKAQVSGLHFGAFRSESDRIEPVFYHIRNTYDFNAATGQHEQIGPFWQQEQFMSRDVQNLQWPPREVRERLRNHARATGLPFWYRNGDLILFATVTGHIQTAVHQVSRLPGYTTPERLAGWERLARTMVITTTQVARCLYRGRFPTIGDVARVLSERWPPVGW